MKWLVLHIDTVPAGIEPLCDLLTDLGIEGLVIEDEADFEAFLAQNQQYWDYVDEALVAQKAGCSRVSFYVPEDADGLGMVAAVRVALQSWKQAHPEYGPLLMHIDNIADADWENNWKQYYKPIKIGRRLLVVPQWEQAEDPERVKLILNPGLSFGTGSHATTKLCLTALEQVLQGGEQVLDLGCGSGILSIAALCLGAKRAFACDIDEKAVEVACENAALNKVGEHQYTVQAGDILQDGALLATIGSGWDVVVANIVADVIMGLAPMVRPMLREGGIFLCAGIIDSRAGEVADCLRQNGWQIIQTRSEEGWFAYTCR